MPEETYALTNCPLQSAASLDGDPKKQPWPRQNIRRFLHTMILRAIYDLVTPLLVFRGRKKGSKPTCSDSQDYKTADFWIRSENMNHALHFQHICLYLDFPLHKVRKIATEIREYRKLRRQAYLCGGLKKKVVWSRVERGGTRCGALPLDPKECAAVQKVLTLYNRRSENRRKPAKSGPPKGYRKSLGNRQSALPIPLEIEPIEGNSPEEELACQ